MVGISTSILHRRLCPLCDKDMFQYYFRISENIEHKKNTFPKQMWGKIKIRENRKEVPSLSNLGQEYMTILVDFTERDVVDFFKEI